MRKSKRCAESGPDEDRLGHDLSEHAESSAFPSSGSGPTESLHTKVLSPSEFLAFHGKQQRTDR
jgi:hypothetical protein